MSEDDFGVLVAMGEAATRLGVSGAKLKQWVRDGKLRARRMGGALYVSALDIDALLNRCRGGSEVASGR